MSASDSAARRLIDLERILAQSRTQAEATARDAGPVTLHLADVPIDRIRRFTAELQTADGQRDEVAALTMRLLLNDYAAAVAHLRAIARISVDRIDSAVEPIRTCRKYLRSQDKLPKKPAADSSDTSAAS